MDIKGKRVLITGGSSGISFALATCLEHKGAQVATTGRREDALEDAAANLQHAGVASSPVVVDVSTEAGRAGKLETIRQADIRAMLDVDFVARMLLTRSALPHLRERPGALRKVLAEVVRDHTAL